MKILNHKILFLFFLMVAVSLIPQPASADLTPVNIWTGNVGLSIDAVGSKDTPVGDIQADIPIGATILRAYLYSAGTPSLEVEGSPTTFADYNSAGITIAGNSVNNFDTLVGAVSGRDDIGEWHTGRADVTELIRSLVVSTAPDPDYYSWSISKSSLNEQIDGEVLAIVYEQASLPQSSVVLLDGGQDTDGETTTVNFAPLGVVDDDFFADMSLGISFSTGYVPNRIPQVSTVIINEDELLTSAAGGFDDGITRKNGSLITVGGIGDDNTNPEDPESISARDDELYDLSPFLSQGDTSFTIFTENPSDDDNIFFMGLHLAAVIESVNPPVDPTVDPPVNPVPEPATLLLLGTGLAGLMGFYRRKVR